MNQIKKATFDHLNLTVTSFKDSVEWYGKVFGFKLVEQGMDQDGPWGVLRSGDSMLCIYESPKRLNLDDSAEGERFHQIYHFGLRVDDRATWEATVKTHGIKLCYGGAIRYPHSTSWYVTDPTGHNIEVSYWDEDEVKFDGLREEASKSTLREA